MQQNGAPRGQKTAARAREVEEQATHVGLRAQRTPPPGERPGILTEPEPQWVDAALSYIAVVAPSLETLPFRAWKGLDSSTVRFLAKK